MGFGSRMSDVFSVMDWLTRPIASDSMNRFRHNCSMRLAGWVDPLVLQHMVMGSLTAIIVSFSSRSLNRWTINWNRLILLWGPPGTGKTSLWCVIITSY